MAVIAWALYSAGAQAIPITDPERQPDDWLSFLPGRSPYPEYVADPHRIGFGAAVAEVDEARIPRTGTNRTLLRMGGAFGMLRLGRGAKAVYVDLRAGFVGQFDNDFGQDNIGWDGHYGLALTGSLDSWFWKFAYHHISAHRGDEYVLATGSDRIGYTREELNVGLAKALGKRTRIYAEVGWGNVLASPELEPWRVQTGFQWEDRSKWWSGRIGPYIAFDFSATEERDWRLDRAVQFGLVTYASERPWRLGISVYKGRPTMSEFFRYTERFVSLGLSTDI